MSPVWGTYTTTERVGPTIRAEIYPELLLPMIQEIFEPRTSRRARQMREALEQMAKLKISEWPEEAQKKYMATFYYEPGALRRIFRPSERAPELLFAPGVEEMKIKSPLSGRTERITETPEKAEPFMPIHLLKAPAVPSQETMREIDEWLKNEGITDETERRRLRILMATGQKIEMSPEEEAQYTKRKVETLADLYGLTGDERQDFIDRAIGIAGQNDLTRTERRVLAEMTALKANNPQMSLTDVIGRISPNLRGISWKLLEKFASFTEKESQLETLKLRRKLLELKEQFDKARIKELEERRKALNKAAATKDYVAIMRLAQAAYRNYVTAFTNYVRNHNTLARQINRVAGSEVESYIDERPLSMDQWLTQTEEGQLFSNLLSGSPQEALLGPQIPVPPSPEKERIAPPPEYEFWSIPQERREELRRKWMPSK